MPRGRKPNFFNIKHTLEESDQFFSSCPVDKWSFWTFVTYFYFLRTTFFNVPFVTMRSVRDYVAMRQLVSTYGKRDMKRILEGLFLYQKELCSEIKPDFIKSLGLLALRSATLQPKLQQVLTYLNEYDRVKVLPEWKKKPQHLWNEMDHQQFRKTMTGGEHGQTQKVS